MTCTDGGEDNSSVHATYHEDQVTLGSDLLSAETRKTIVGVSVGVFVCPLCIRMRAREHTVHYVIGGAQAPGTLPVFPPPHQSTSSHLHPSLQAYAPSQTRVVEESTTVNVPQIPKIGVVVPTYIQLENGICPKV